MNLTYFCAFFCASFLLIVSTIGTSSSLLSVETKTTDSKERFPCPLKWISTRDILEELENSDATSLSQKLVSINQLVPSMKFGSTIYWGMLRTPSSNPDLIPVTFSTELGSFVKTLLDESQSEIIRDPFHILANPNNCSVKLTSLQESALIKTKFLVPLSPNATTYLATQISSEKFLGTAESPLATAWNLCLIRFIPQLKIVSTRGYYTNHQFQETYLLKSFVDKIELQVKVIELLDAEEKVEKYEIQFGSYDKFINQGGGIKEETVQHVLLVEKTWKSTVGLSIKAGLYLMVEFELLLRYGPRPTDTQPFFSIVLHLGFELMADLFLKHHIREIVSMSVGQTLRIPPHTKVEVCSTVTVKHYDLTILSQVEISHPFLSNADLLTVLQEDSKRFADVVEDETYRKITATLIQTWRASEPWTSSNYVLPLGSLDSKGNPVMDTCTSLNTSIQYELESGRLFKSEQEVSNFLSGWKNI